MLSGIVLLAAPGSLVHATCTVVEESAGDSSLFVRHLSSDCTKAERAARAIPAKELLGALKAGKGISLKNVVVTGDLLLTQLDAVSLTTLALPARILEQLGVRVTEARVIPGMLLIERSTVEGLIDTQLKPDMQEHRVLGDMVVVRGRVTFRGTTFAKAVDLSRTIFLGPVDSSEAIYLDDALFISSIFDRRTTFEKTAFAGNARFYQAVFHEPVTFLRAGFSGLTNFLSVNFKKETSFSRSYFKMGTGFSGSRFEGISDFSEAVFEKNVFFMHAVFVADSYFRRATFRGEVSFADAEFRGKDDFAKVFYQQEPNLTRTKFATPRSAAGFENPVFLAIVGVSLAVFLIAFVVILRKG